VSPELTPFEKLLVALVRGGVDFTVVGCVACALNGHVRTTEDVDLLIARDAANVARLLDVLRKVGEGHARELCPDDFSDEEGAIRVVEDFPIDIFVRIGGRHLEDLRQHICHCDIGSVPVTFLSVEGLILLKAGSAREKDRLDVAALRRLLSSQQD